MNRSLLIAVFLAIFATVWVLSGSIGSDEEQIPAELANDQAAETEDLFKVKARDIQAASMQDALRLQGETDAIRSVVLKAETHGSIDKLLVEKGQRVKKGQPLFELSLDDRPARLQQAKSDLQLAKSQLQSGERLQKNNLISSIQLAELRATVVSAEAAVTQITVEIGHTKVAAPFSGILDDLHIEQGDFLAVGDPIAELIDDSQIKILARVPQQHISRIKLGQIATAHQVDGSTVSGPITYVSSAAQLETRTFSIEALVDNNDQNMRLRQSARVILDLGETAAHKIPTSSLELAANGDIFVKGLNAENIVLKVPVEMIRAENDGVWVSGLPEQFRIISVGAAFVLEGQKVDVALEEVSG